MFGFSPAVSRDVTERFSYVTDAADEKDALSAETHMSEDTVGHPVCGAHPQSQA